MSDFDFIEIKGLTKIWGPVRALMGIDLTAHLSEVIVIEGPNGAGKSTLLSIIAQLARPTKGSVDYGELTLEEARGRVGIVAHSAMLYPDLTGRENLNFVSKLYQCSSKKNIDQIIDQFDLMGFCDRPVKTYSRGQIQRTSLARALIHQPRLLLLDEPTTGLDQRSVERLSDLIETQKNKGTIQIMVSHDASFARSVATRTVRLERGKIV